MSEDRDFFDISELIDDYYADTISLLDKISDVLLSVDKAIKDNPEKIREVQHILGPLHTIKGNSGMLGFSGLQKYVHETEGIIKSYMENPDQSVAPALIDFLFNAEKNIRKAVEQIKNFQKEPDNLNELAEKISSLKDNLSQLATATSEKDDQESDEEEFVVSRETQLIKIDFSKLDRQINLLGELIIYRTRLDQVENSLLQKYPRDPAVQELVQLSQAMGKKITELQEAVMSLRLLPIKNLFTVIPRIVREEAKKTNKEIEVEITGEETELDKSVIDQLHEPLLHIIRNAVDHGIELPEERIKKGKLPAGKISVSAKQESNFIIITIEDDGKGIDVDEVYNVAVEKGLIEKGKRPSDREILNLIFTPGFSTTRVATTTSGRGVGLEVVAEVLSSLGGSIEVETTPDVGTKFILKIPLTLAIITALMVEADKEIYAIPTSAVQESIKITKNDLKTVRGNEVIILRGSIIPILFLHKIIEKTVSEQNHYYYVVIVSRNDQRIGIVVDKLRGQQEIVIKSLDESIMSPIIAGATILGNGKIVLILDITTILNETSQTGSAGNVYRVL